MLVHFVLCRLKYFFSTVADVHQTLGIEFIKHWNLIKLHAYVCRKLSHLCFLFQNIFFLHFGMTQNCVRFLANNCYTCCAHAQTCINGWLDAFLGILSISYSVIICSVNHLDFILLKTFDLNVSLVIKLCSRMIQKSMFHLNVWIYNERGL